LSGLRDYVRRLYTLRGAFRRCFLGTDGKPTADGLEALAELRRFCYGARAALKTGANGIDPYATVAAAARQEVFFRVMDMLNLDDSDLVALTRRAELEDQAGG
jgi:hypothetical protein